MKIEWWSRTFRTFVLEVYGHWCGPGHSGPENPLDRLDGVCKDHDLCYRQNGWSAVECDVDLVLEVRQYRAEKAWKKAPKKARARVAAWAIQTIFSLRPAVRKQLKALKAGGT